MTRITSLHAIAGAFLACGFSAAPAAALVPATFVSGGGTDSGTCTRALPCKSFAFALSQTAAGGLIIVLDPAGYGKVTITQSVSILNEGVGTAGLAISSGDAITINAGAGDSVHLRGLTIEGFGTGTNGILFNTGGNLEIENCVVRNFKNNGIAVSPSTSGSFSISKTIASNNAGSGILVQPIGAAVVTGVLSNVTANNNFHGIFVNGAATTGASLMVTAVDSVASENDVVGVLAASASAHAATAVMLRNVVASNNHTGLDAEVNTTLRVAHSVVTGNGTGVFRTGDGILDSYGDNDIDGNTSNNTAVLTTLIPH